MAESQLSVTVLVENTVGGLGPLAEHGLSFWITLGDRQVLFDSGQGAVLLGNARHLGVPLERVDAVVLSHGHYDHSGGLRAALMQVPSRVPLYAHPEALGRKYVRNADGRGRDAGIPAAAAAAVASRAEFVPVSGALEIGAGMCLTGPVPRVTDFEDTGGPFFSDVECTTPDDLIDDQAAFVETAAGTVVILGCAHAGVINTLLAVRELTGNRPIDTVIGGMHLLSAGPERMSRTVVALRDLRVRRLMPCHCTGFAATVRLWQEFPGQCEVCRVGTAVRFPECAG